MKLCSELGVKILNLSAGSPYYNHHIQRPALYPPSDGYQPPHDPLIDVVRQIQVVRQLKAQAPANLILVGTAYSYLQEYLPHVAQAVLRQGWVDSVGIGRAVLSYPTMLSDSVRKGSINSKQICRTFSDCTTAPRNGNGQRLLSAGWLLQIQTRIQTVATEQDTPSSKAAIAWFKSRRCDEGVFWFLPGLGTRKDSLLTSAPTRDYRVLKHVPSSNKDRLF